MGTTAAEAADKVEFERELRIKGLEEEGFESFCAAEVGMSRLFKV